MSDNVLLDREDGVATLTMNQPDRMNALSEDLQEAMMERLHELLDPDDTPRCLVIEGAGEVFSAGGDIEAIQRIQESDDSPDVPVRHIEELTHRFVAELVRFPAPTVAKVDGMAVGAGANVAIACDLQLASEEASIGFLFRKIGLSIDSATSYLLPRLVGMNTAKELVYTGEILEADRALDLGLFNRVFDEDEFDEQADEMIDQIASGPTTALRHSKRLLESGHQKGLEKALRDESANQGMIFDTDDFEEGMNAFLEGRDPEFSGK